MVDLAPHPGIDAAVSKLLNATGRVAGGAIPEMVALVSTDAHAALYLNVVAPRFLPSLSATDQALVATALVKAAETIEVAIPNEAELWRDAAASPRRSSHPPRGIPPSPPVCYHRPGARWGSSAIAARRHRGKASGTTQAQRSVPP